ncbi:NADPH-dependent F420 reductase [uncultured Sneathiella sp.]|jgi:hypothetical protein|uniref:NADPH-dependent F420 reductase n=1 Tax=uncultured Sneathiella sp. TaxID=879315 RepID=UPI0030D97BD6|tara:strand:+ start:59940 stop:60590 length:651 start_codon:yes stop_codon:yes gene_type:complete
MNIAIIGTGNVGTGLAKVLSKTRHGVVFGARTEDKGHAAADAFVKEYGGNVRGSDVAGAVRDADVVILAVPYAETADVIAIAGSLSGKIVIDATNPLTEDFSGLTLGFESSAAEEIQKRVAGAPAVKAFNTVFAQIYAEGPRFSERPVQVFYAGDDDAAKKVVSEIINAAGFDAVDAGPLKNARYLEPLAALNIQLGYSLGRGTQIAPAWIEREAA